LTIHLDGIIFAPTGYLAQQEQAMKYFTRGWSKGELDDETSDQMRAAYWDRVKSLRSSMPASVNKLATATKLHDAVIDRISWDRRRRNLKLELVLVDDHSHSGSYGVTLLYKGVQLSDKQIGLLAERARDRRTEILYSEVDLEENGTWVHRMLFEPVGEISIWFSSLKLSRTRGKDTAMLGYDPFFTAD
jgi:hypothetical protein